MRLPLLILHILGGTVGLLAGTVAMSVRKGGPLHRNAGNIFTFAMLTLASSGLCLAIMKSQGGNIIGSVATFYMIGTAWMAGRSRNRTGLMDWVAPVFGLAGTAAATAIGVYTLHHPSGVPAGMSFFIAFVLLLATGGDLRLLIHHGISQRQRITRHLWRMCFGLFIATGSFFLGQQQVFPAYLRGSMLLTIPAFLPFPLMLYWLIRIRFSKTYRPQVQANPAAVTS